MADKRFPSLPGFRDFAPRDCAVRNYLFEKWRDVARRYGFVEYEAPILESTSLYQKKAGEELNTQLFRFEDQGGRDVTLRPELTASLARMICANQRDFTKPMKWFEIGPCFRYEAPQKGRGREFIQFNVDIIGEGSAEADAELIAFAIDTMVALGFSSSDFELRASDRQSWTQFCEEKKISDISGLLQIIDKFEREKPEVLKEKLGKLGLSVEEVEAFIKDDSNASESFKAIQANLNARGLGDFLKHDLTIVRGLAYYTGVVFEIFDTQRSMRAVAGGGRYDDLIKVVSNDAMDLCCTGFAMGDMVIRNFIEETPNACIQLEAWLMEQAQSDFYVVIADEEKRLNALEVVTTLRTAGYQVHFPLAQTKFNKQFKKAEDLNARHALIIGDEFPQLKLKNLAQRSEKEITYNDHFIANLSEHMEQPDSPYIA